MNLITFCALILIPPIALLLFSLWYRRRERTIRILSNWEQSLDAIFNATHVHRILNADEASRELSIAQSYRAEGDYFELQMQAERLNYLMSLSQNIRRRSVVSRYEEWPRNSGLQQYNEQDRSMEQQRPEVKNVMSKTHFKNMKYDVVDTILLGIPLRSYNPYDLSQVSTGKKLSDIDREDLRLDERPWIYQLAEDPQPTHWDRYAAGRSSLEEPAFFSPQIEPRPTDDIPRAGICPVCGSGNTGQRKPGNPHAYMECFQCGNVRKGDFCGGSPARAGGFRIEGNRERDRRLQHLTTLQEARRNNARLNFEGLLELLGGSISDV